MKRTVLLILALVISLLSFVSCVRIVNGKADSTDEGEIDANAKPYEFVFLSNGDGTCKVTGVTFGKGGGSPITLVFPDASPDGERVTSIDYEVMSAVPRWIPAEDFQSRISEPLLAAVENGAMGGVPKKGKASDNFYYKQTMVSYKLISSSDKNAQSDLEELYQKYPIAQEIPIYVVDETISEFGFCMLEMQMQIAGYTADLAHQAHERCGYVTDLTPQNAVVYPTTIVEMIFPAGVEYVNPSVYRHCYSLERLTLPECVTSVSEFDFAVKENLTALSLKGVKVLPESWNRSCNALKEITLSASVESVWLRSFLKKEEVLTVHYGGTVEQWEQINKTVEADRTHQILVICTDGELTLK